MPIRQDAMSSSDKNAPRVTRHRCGKGFTYRYASGRTLRDKTRRRWIQSLAIPPAWREVEITLDDDARVHATGRDDAGRKQYIYNAAWRERREQAAQGGGHARGLSGW